MAGLEGKTIGKYRIIERLGRGGMATVYKAYHPSLDRYVAIKMLHGYLAEGENFLERFEQEAQSVATLRHHNIVQVFDFDNDGENYYMVMEFVSGGTLKAKMTHKSGNGGVFSVEESIRIINQIAEALDYAHKKGMIHRDIKPSNVLINEEGEILLTDFGIARILSKGGTQLTATGALIGTPAYMPPEQGRGEKEITPASDIYSLGIIFYELLTGHVPFDADTPMAIIHKHIHSPLPIPHDFQPEFPTPLEKVLLKSLAKDPEDRYQSAREMINAIEKAFSKGEENLSEQTRLSMPKIQETRISAEKPHYTQPVRVSEPPKEQLKSAGKRKVARVFGWGIVGVLFLVGIVIFTWILNYVGVLNFGGFDCATVKECEVQAYILRDQGDLREAKDYLAKAIGMVPEQEHPSHAELWCRMGEMSIALDELDQAVSDFSHCFAWTEDDPGLGWLRKEAGDQLQELNR
ncbi:MAG: hypothetical protein B6243_08045 [Anaerolineaceae bacterium 4572_5.2]|nr:MAG: hypothetical protein B6243_08045 [Anaerolineaceae bacterium 4572_5.2]